MSMSEAITRSDFYALLIVGFWLSTLAYYDDLKSEWVWGLISTAIMSCIVAGLVYGLSYGLRTYVSL